MYIGSDESQHEAIAMKGMVLDEVREGLGESSANTTHSRRKSESHRQSDKRPSEETVFDQFTTTAATGAGTEQDFGDWSKYTPQYFRKTKLDL